MPHQQITGVDTSKAKALSGRQTSSSQRIKRGPWHRYAMAVLFLPFSPQTFVVELMDCLAVPHPQISGDRCYQDAWRLAANRRAERILEGDQTTAGHLARSRG